MQSFHLRGDLDEVAAAVSEYLDAEGFTLTENQDVRDPSVRRIALYAEDGWVGIAEERFAAAEWGPVLSAALATEVVTLDGECDHAFYTHVFVHANGDTQHAARVPEDVTLDDDGHHRLRAAFLPSAIVVSELGGEENMQAIGEVMGIPRPLFHVDDEATALTLYFAYTSDAPAKAPDFAKLFGPAFAGMSEEITAAMGSLKLELAPGMRALMGVATKSTGGPPRLAPCQESTTVDAFAGRDGHVYASFLLEDAESAKGLTVSLYGEGLEIFEAKRIRARVASAEWTAPAAVQEGLVMFSLPDVELAQPPRRDTSHLPLEERMRQGMKRLSGSPVGAHPAEVTVWVEGRFLAAGEVELALTAQLSGHDESAATTDLVVRVKPAVRAPVLPAGAPAPHPTYVESYESRKVAFGWLGFDAPWSDVNRTVMQIAREAEQVLREATGVAKLEGTAQLRSGDRLTLKKEVWSKVESALEAGADVSLQLGALLQGASIEIVHQSAGPNLLPELTWESGGRNSRPPPVWLAWWCPRPDSEAGARALARLAERAFELARRVPSSVGGIASAQAEAGYGIFSTAYDRMANLNGTNDARWLRTHPRGPAWRVLLPCDLAVADLTDDRIVRSTAPDPFAYSASDAEAMERLIVPLLG